MNLQEILMHFRNVKNAGENLYRADCPACGDTKQHLYISAIDGKILVDCKKRCTFSEIVQASGLKASDFFDKSKNNNHSKEKWKLLRTHQYTDNQGNVIAQKEIYDIGDGKKTAVWYRAEGNKFLKGLNKQKMPLYHIHKFINADKSVPLYIVEGEKDVETLEKMGLIATTSPNGAGSKWRKSDNIFFSGWNIVILADNDEVGVQHAEQIAEAIKNNAKAVKLIRSNAIYPELKEKGDISDIVKEVGIENAKKMLFEAQKNTQTYDTAVDVLETSNAEDIIIDSDGYDFEKNEGKLFADERRSHVFTIGFLKKYLENRKIKIKHDLITHKIQVMGVKNEYEARINNNIVALIYNDIKHMQDANKDNIATNISIIADRNKYNPILEMLDTVTWDGVDRLEQVYDMFQIDTSDWLSRVLMRKWFMQCVCGLHNTLTNPYPLDIILVLQGSQGTGKTSFFKHIAMNPQYFGGGSCVDVRNKDSQMRTTSKWITELGEIGSTMRQDKDATKAFLTLSSDEYRAPYDRTFVEYPRLTSFCGTVNEGEYLIDETGNRRYATIPLKPDLYIKYSTIENFNSLQFWKQISEMVEDEIRKTGCDYAGAFRINDNEREELAKRNGAHEKPMKSEIEVTDVLTKLAMLKADKSKKVVMTHMTVTDFIMQHAELRAYNAVQVGKVLEKLGYPKIRKKIDGKVVAVRELPKFIGCANYPEY